MEIYLIRHPAVIVGSGVCYGHSDVEVSVESFEVSVEKIMTVIPDYGNLTFYSSDLKRCSNIAEKLCGTPIFFSKEIREMNFGEWELKRWSDLSSETFRSWMANFVDEKCPGGESYNELSVRAVAFWKELIKKDHDRVAIITHSGVIRSILCYILGVSLKNSFKFKIDYSSISLVKTANNSEVIEYMNK